MIASDVIKKKIFMQSTMDKSQSSDFFGRIYGKVELLLEC